MKRLMQVAVASAVSAVLWVGGAGRGVSGEVPAAETPAPVNPYAGMQEREEVFEFAQKPQVKKEGDKWVITFASKAACDATVAIVGKDGKIVRHLASGVLGKNAPYPFQQNSLSQKIEWDGLTTDFKKAEAAGCSVRVSLGLKPEMESSLQFDPYEFPGDVTKQRGAGKLLVGRKGDEVYVLKISGDKGGDATGRVFDKDGKYLRTFWPVPAKDLEKLPKYKGALAKTDWGDSIFVPAKGGVTLTCPGDDGKAAFEIAGVTDFKEEARPANLPAPTLDPRVAPYHDAGKGSRLAVDRAREELYFGICKNSGLYRLNAKTDKIDETWFPKGEMSKLSEVYVGPDGNVYIGVGSIGYNHFIFRVDHEGNPVKFGGDAIPFPTDKWVGGGGQYGDMEGKGIYGGGFRPGALRGKDVNGLWTGLFAHSNTFDLGLHVSPAGNIVATIQSPAAVRLLKYEAPANKVKVLTHHGPDHEIINSTSFVSVWDKDGKLLTANAVGDTGNGHGVAMDRDGNIYAAMASRFPEDRKALVGLSSLPVGTGSFVFDYGILLKFRGGIPYPRAKTYDKGEAAPAGALKVSGYLGNVAAIEGRDGALLWNYGGLCRQRAYVCTCDHLRYDMDYFARHWLPADYLYSVMVVDTNGNIMARVGRYGNASDEDPACGRLHFVWPKALCASDTALYVSDGSNRRIVKAAIKYAAEESVPLP